MSHTRSAVSPWTLRHRAVTAVILYTACAPMQALSHIAHRLEQLHESGWVHRDLKPGNILRLPRDHSWTLMDFGCAAPTGAPQPPSDTCTMAPLLLVSSLPHAAVEC